MFRKVFGSAGKGFWLLQIIGWGFIMVANFWGKIFMTDKLPPSYFIVEGIIFFILGVLVSSFLRLQLKELNLIGNASKKKYLKAFQYFIVDSFVFTAFTFVFAIFAHYIIVGSMLDLSLFQILLTELNFFLLLIMWGVLYLGIKSLIHLRKEKINRLELETALKEAQLNTLKGQINPHFMFNSLNNIRGLMLEDVDKSREMLTRLSEMLRYSLNADNTDTISLSEEIDIVENYVALSKIQLEDRLIFTKVIDPKLMAVKIPPMLLQLLIENAIKHGVSNLINGGEVKLTVDSNEDLLFLNVENSGVIKDHADSTKIGIENIKKRLKILYGDEASFSLLEKNNWVVARIVLPINQS